MTARHTDDELRTIVKAAPLCGTTEPEAPEDFRLDTVEPRPIKGLWFGRLASGEMTVITGAPGVGKGLLLCYIVACYTTSRPMHGDRHAQPAGDVLWIAVEDAHDTALVPRLIAAGAERSRVHAWNMDRPLSLPEDTDRIVARIDAYHCGITFIDPAQTLINKDFSANADADVRRTFSPLAAACRARDCALVLVRHTNKRQLGTAMDRGGGSIGWSGMARVELMLGRRVSDPEAATVDVDESIITLATVKNNLQKWAPSLNMRIVEAGESARLEVIGETKSTADDLCAQARPRTARKTGSAEEIIRRILSDGQWHRQIEIESAAAKAEVSESTLKRAKKSLGVDSIKRGSAWLWQLPKGFNSSESESHEPLGRDVACEPLHSNNNNNLGFEEGQGVQESHSPTDEPLGGEADAV